jgi:hypothetical protein
MHAVAGSRDRRRSATARFYEDPFARLAALQAARKFKISVVGLFEISIS